MRRAQATVAGLTLLLAIGSSPANAQIEEFVHAVQQVADAARLPEPARTLGIRNAGTRMGAALAEWDRRIGALEAGVAREVASASPQRAYQLHVELGVAYRARGRTAEALRELDAAVAIRSSASDVQVLRALTLEAAGRFDEAGRAFQAAWALDPHSQVKAYYVAQRAGDAGAVDRTGALAALTNAYQHLALETRPTTPAFLTLEIADNLSRTPVIADDATAAAFALLRAQQYSAAAEALAGVPRAAASTANAPSAHFRRGQDAEAHNRVADARREYQAALAGTLVGRSPLYVGLARLAQVDGDQPAAIDAFREAVRLTPNDPNVHKELAFAYAAEGRGDDAFCELIAALLIDPRDAQAHAGIGQIHLDAGRDADAVTAFTRALEVMPERYETRYLLATALTRLGRAEEAARQLERFERARREALARRRHDIANDVEKEEAIRDGQRNQSGGR